MNAQAIVNVLKFPPLGGGEGLFAVRVWLDDGSLVRIYTVTAESDNLAAQEGLRRFVEEAAQA
jgi:hypothetical protein